MRLEFLGDIFKLLAFLEGLLAALAHLLELLLRLFNVLYGDLALLNGTLAALEQLGDSITVALGHVCFFTLDFFIGGLILITILNIVLVVKV